MTRFKKHCGVWTTAALFMCLTMGILPVFAQDAQQIVDALKPAAAASRTRGLRNLRVDQVDVLPGATQAPSISLTIGFDFDSSNISTESHFTLKTLATALQSHELHNLNFQIEGHTDAKGKADYNQRLSQSRANAVKQQLEKLGVEGGRLNSVGKGDSELVNRQDPFAAENRRVKIVTLTP
jgi:outer membrane protein OmpA-like peptidoglycan-associated protein